MKNLLVSCLILFIFFLSLCVWWEVSEPKLAILEDADKIEAACCFHGYLCTLFTWRTKDGVWYFKRDGKDCRLFTEDFEDKYKWEEIKQINKGKDGKNGY